MERQLRLLDSLDGRRPEWELDDETRRIGRQGVAAARAALRKARRGGDDRRQPPGPDAPPAAA